MRCETSNIKCLPELHRMGHTCTNLNGELFFIWGGIDDDKPYPSTENNNLWIYETVTGYWRRRNCSGECPPHLSSPSSALIGQRMYLFGGHSNAQDNWRNSLYCLDLETFVWTDLSSRASAEPTKPIRSDKCVSWSYNGHLYLFGGYGWSQTEHLLELLDKQKDLQLTPDQRWPKFGWNNQLVEFDPRDNTWRWPSYTGRCPSARAAHSGALMGNKYYLFGGRDCRERLNDLYTLDMDTFEWTQIAVLENPSHGRLEMLVQHLLEPEQSNQQELVYQQEAEVIQDDNDGEFNPSPSSSGPIRIEETLGYSSDEDESFEYPHPSHLLERWSLSFHQSTSSSSSIDSGHCHQQQAASALLNGLINFQTDQNHSQINHQKESNNMASNSSPVELPSPEGRSFASFTPLTDQDILLYGGVSSQNENLDDCWIFDIKSFRWTQINLNIKHPRLWHTGARTKNNEVVIIGGSCSDKIDKFCSDILIISQEPKSLKRLTLDTIARSIHMRSINKLHELPSTISKLIKLRKQAMALTMRGYFSRPPITAV